MKAKADTFRDAYSTLQELRMLETTVYDIYVAMSPYKEADTSDSLPRFITRTSMELQGLIVKDFEKAFPSISALVINGSGPNNESFGRIHDACYTFDKFQRTALEQHCVFRSDKERIEARKGLGRVVADLCVFTCVQFELYKAQEDDTVMVSVKEYCDRQGIGVDVLYSLFLQDLQDVGEEWAAYEQISPLYGAMEEFDPILMNECEEALFPLTDDMAEKLLDGVIDAAYIRGLIVEHLKGEQDINEKILPIDLIKKMKLS